MMNTVQTLERRVSHLEDRIESIESEMLPTATSIVRVEGTELDREQAGREVLRHLLERDLPVDVDEIAEALGLPFQQVNDIVRELAQKGVLELE